MKNKLMIIFALFAMLTVSAFAEQVQTATIQVENDNLTYRNGDVVTITGENFAEGDEMRNVTVVFYDESNTFIVERVLSTNDGLISDGFFSGSVQLSNIPSSAKFAQILINANYSNVRTINSFTVLGNEDFNSNSFSILGSLTITENGGDGIAQTSEQLNLSGSTTENTIFSARVEEYTNNDGTGTQTNTTIAFGSASAAGGTFSGSVNSIGSYQASTKSIRVFLATHDGTFTTFDFSTSNSIVTPDTDPPGLISAVANSSTNIRVTFDEAVEVLGTPGGANFTFTNFGGAVTAVTSTGGASSTTWNLTVNSNPGVLSATATIAYVQGTTNGLQDAAGNEVEATAPAVNITDAVAPTAPTLTAPTLSTIFTTEVNFTATADAGATDGSLDEIRFQGSANGTTGWTTVATDNDVADADYAGTHSLGTKYAFYRALAVDDAGNTTASSTLGSLTDVFRVEIISIETPVFENETAEVVIETQNNYADAVARSTTFDLGYVPTTSGTGTFYSDDAGTSVITFIDIVANATSATYYYSQPAASTSTLTITAGGSDLDDDTDSGSITVNSATVTGFDFVVNGGGNPTAGTAFSVQLTAKNGVATQTNYTGTKSITITSSATASPDGTAPVLPSAQSVTFTAGVGTVTGVTLFNSGETPTLTASDGTNNGTSGAITVDDDAIAEVRVKSAADGGEGQFDSNIFDTQSYQGATQANPDESVTLFAEGYDQYGNRTTPSNYGWSATGGLTANASLSSPTTNSSNTVTFDGTPGTTITGTVSVSINAGAFTDATGTITVDDAAPSAPSSFTATDADENDIVTFEWNGSSSGDDGTSGSITSFELRMTTAGQINDDTKWNSATSIFTGNASTFSNGIRNVNLTGSPLGDYFFAIRTTDDVGNVSNISFTTAGDITLPVSLTSFEALSEAGKIKLRWETASEVNNEGFFIYRSLVADGPFNELVNNSIVSGNGNTNSTSTYEFVDADVEAEKTYYYQLISRDFDGTLHTNTIIASVTVVALPTEFELAQNYPNPFNPNTNFRFSIAENSTASLEIYNILGQRIRTIFSNRTFEPGNYDGIQWDATDNNGNVVAGGIYYYVFSVKENNFREVRKMVFLK